LKKPALLPEDDSEGETKIEAGDNSAVNGNLVIDVEEESDRSSIPPYVFPQVGWHLGFHF